jgi:hypothetical protein
MHEQDALCPNNIHEKNGSANDVQQTHPLPIDRKRQQQSQKPDERVIRNSNHEKHCMLMPGSYLRPIPIPTAAVAPNSFKKYDHRSTAKYLGIGLLRYCKGRCSGWDSQKYVHRNQKGKAHRLLPECGK